MISMSETFGAYQAETSRPRAGAIMGGERGLQRILVATDGSPASDGALRLASILAGQSAIPVEVLSILDPAADATAHVRPEVVVQVEQRFALVRAQVNAALGRKPDWRTSIDIGPIAETISRLGSGRGADLVIVGFGQHRRMRDRAPDKATVRRITELSTTPIMVVPSNARTLPANAMLALDFSRASIRAARAALSVMATPGVMHLVYVHTTNEPFPAPPPDPDATYAAGFASFFEAVEHELDPPPGIVFKRVVIQLGDIVSELLAYASVNEVDLIVAGKHGKSMHDRIQLGSVSAGILRSAQCAVVVSGSGEAPSGNGSTDAQISAQTTRGD